MRTNRLFRPGIWLFASLFLSVPLLSGRAVALLAGGAVGGYAVAKHMEEDDALRKKNEGNKGWFGGGNDK